MRRRALAAAAAAVALPAWVRGATAADIPRFELGVASGLPRPDRVVIWTRLTGPDLATAVPVRWAVAHDEAFTRLARQGGETAHADDAHTLHVDVTGLEPGRGYWYRFEALGQRSRAGRTRTAPAPDALAPLRLAIASCQRFDHGHYAAWRQVADDAPDVVAFLGDYIYEYPSLPTALRPHRGQWLRTLDDYRARYAQYKSDPHLQAAHAACPWVLTWDDHEVVNDYAGTHATTPLGLELTALRATAYQAWWEHQPLPRALRPRGPAAPVYGRLDWGRLARLHLLDTRQYRDVQACPPPLRTSGGTRVNPADCAALADPSRTLLGAEQERWLTDGWSVERPWNLVLQQTLMARFTQPPDGTVWTDGWDGYPAARRRLLSTVAERRVGGVVVLGGDVHAHHVADLKADFDDERSPVVASEFCGSSISSHGRSQRAADSARAVHPHMHLAQADRRGTVTFDVDPQALQARVMTVDRPDDPASPVRVDSRWVVDAARPGPQRA